MAAKKTKHRKAHKKISKRSPHRGGSHGKPKRRTKSARHAVPRRGRRTKKHTPRARPGAELLAQLGEVRRRVTGR